MDICEIICLMSLIVADTAVVAISACLDLLSLPFPSNYNKIELDPQIKINIITINSYSYLGVVHKTYLYCNEQRNIKISYACQIKFDIEGIT